MEALGEEASENVVLSNGDAGDAVNRNSLRETNRGPSKDSEPSTADKLENGQGCVGELDDKSALIHRNVNGAAAAVTDRS